MKKLLYTITLALIINFSYSQQLRLNTINNHAPFFRGDTIHYSVKLIDEDYSTIFTRWNAILKDIPAPEKHYYVVAEDLGDMKIGPYSLNTGKKTIKSGTLSFEIRDENLKGDKIFIEAPDSIKMDKTYKIRFICLIEPINNITFSKKIFLKTGSSSTASQMQVINGVTSQEFSKTFEIAFVEKGTYIIDSSWIIGKSDFMELVPFKIVVY